MNGRARRWLEYGLKAAVLTMAAMLGGAWLGLLVLMASG